MAAITPTAGAGGLLNSGLNATPSPTKSAISSNYVDFTADGNGWAHIMNRDIDEIEYCLTSSQFSKYEAVNLKKFATLGCIEYRQHQSTFNADKILNWIRMLHKFQTTAVNEENTHRDMNMYEPDSIQSLMSYLGMPSASSRYFGQRALQLRR